MKHLISKIDMSKQNLIKEFEKRDSPSKLEFIYNLDIDNPHAIDLFIYASDDSDLEVRLDSINALSGINDEKVIKHLLKALNDENPEVRSAAIYAIDLEENLDIADIFIEKLRYDSDENVRGTAAFILGLCEIKKAFKPLIIALKDNSDYVRGNAAEALGNIGNKKVIKYLVNLFEDEDPYVREGVISGLGKLENYDNLELIVGALQDEDWHVMKKASEVLDSWNWKPKNDLEKLYFLIGKDKWTSYKLSKIKKEVFMEIIDDLSAPIKDNLIYNFKKIGNRKSNEFLAMLLKDKNASIRYRVANALTELEWEPENDIEESYYLVAHNEIDEVKMIGEVAVEALLLVLKDEEEQYRHWKVALALGEIGDKRAVEPLIELLKNDNGENKDNLITALGELRDERAIEPLIELFNDSDEFTQEEAVKSIVKIGNPAVNYLIKVLNDNYDQIKSNISLALLNEVYGDIRKNVIMALGCIGNKKAIDPIIPALNDRNREVKKAAISALGKLKSKKVLDNFIMLLDDKDESIRELAVISLGETGDEKAVKPLINAYFDSCSSMQNEVLESLVQIGEATEIIDNLNNGDKNIRKEIAFILGEIKDKKAVVPLTNSLSDGHRYVRGAAAIALGEIRDSRSVTPLIKALADNSSYVRMRIARSLGNFKDKKAIDALINCLDDAHEDVRVEAARTLGRIKDKRTVDKLILSLKDDDDLRVSEFVAEALGEIGDNKASDYLAEVLEEYTEDYYIYFRFNAAVALAKMKDKRAIKPLINGLKTSNPHYSSMCASMLGFIGDTSAVEPLIEALKSDSYELQVDAAIALGKIGDPRAINPLEELYDSNYPYLVKVSLEALDKIQNIN